MRDIFKNAVIRSNKKLIALTAILYIIFFCADAFAQVKNWVGSSGSDWSTAANWSPAGVPAAGDAVQIGVNSFGLYPSPVLAASTSVASITFGASVPVKSLTVNGTNTTLTVSGNITQQHSTLSILNGLLATSLLGSGRIVCNGNLQLGTPIPNITLLSILGFENTTRIQANINQLEVKGNLNITTSETPLLSFLGLQIGLAKNNALFSFEGGTFVLTNQIITSNYLSPALLGTPSATTTARYQTNAVNNAPALLQLQSANALQINNPATYYENNTTTLKGNSVDFYVPVAGTGIATVEYSGSIAQTVYTSSSTKGLDNAGKPITGSNNTLLQAYQNIKFSGSGEKNIQGGNLFIGGAWLSDNGKINATDNNTWINFSGNSSQQTINDTGSDNGKGVIWRYAIFDNHNIGSDTKTIQSGNFFIAPNGQLIVKGLGSLAVDNLSGGTASLTLQSSATSSATVTALPAASTITGNIKVERFTKGSPADLSKRGYRLLSSAVYTASPIINGLTVQTYDPNYLLNNAFVSGLGGGGFNAIGNPSLYLYREDLVPTGVTFTSSNYKGIAALNMASPFSVKTQNRTNTAYTADTTLNIPAGTGLLFFFRGDKSTNATTTGTKTIAPFNFPEDVIFTSTGKLNQGTINVRTWYAKTDQSILQYSTSIDNNTSPRNVRGFHLLGNPYASSIDWNKLNGQGTVSNSSIYGPNVERTVWFFNPTNKQYGAYTAPSSADTASTTPQLGTDGASNIIASGQAFFVRSKIGGSTFRFMESAKTTTQPSASSLNLLMGVPVSTVPNVQPYMRIQLKKDSINDDEILIRFNNGGSEDYITDEDAEDMGGNGALVSLSSLSGDKKTRLAINGMPPVSLVKKVYLFTDATSSGLYEIRRKELVGLADVYQVWLRDNFMNDSLDLRQNDAYTFRIDKSNAATFGENRFELIFRKKPLPPYELLAFTAENVKEGALLKWKVLNEFAYTQFTVQKADSSQKFFALSKIQSDGEGTYSFIDTKYTGENTSYRILQNKPNGAEIFSTIVTLKNNPQKQFAVYPNPVQSMLNIQTPDEKARYTVKITDIKGRTIFNASVEGVPGKVDMKQAKPGVYILEVRDMKTYELKTREKIIKQ